MTPRLYDIEIDWSAKIVEQHLDNRPGYSVFIVTAEVPCPCGSHLERPQMAFTFPSGHDLHPEIERFEGGFLIRCCGATKGYVWQCLTNGHE